MPGGGENACFLNSLFPGHTLLQAPLSPVGTAGAIVLGHSTGPESMN